MKADWNQRSGRALQKCETWATSVVCISTSPANLCGKMLRPYDRMHGDLIQGNRVCEFPEHYVFALLEDLASLGCRRLIVMALGAYSPSDSLVAFSGSKGVALHCLFGSTEEVIVKFLPTLSSEETSGESLSPFVVFTTVGAEVIEAGVKALADSVHRKAILFRDVTHTTRSYRLDALINGVQIFESGIDLSLNEAKEPFFKNAPVLAAKNIALREFVLSCFGAIEAGALCLVTNGSENERHATTLLRLILPTDCVTKVDCSKQGAVLHEVEATIFAINRKSLGNGRQLHITNIELISEDIAKRISAMRLAIQSRNSTAHYPALIVGFTDLVKSADSTANPNLAMAFGHNTLAVPDLSRGLFSINALFTDDGMTAKDEAIFPEGRSINLEQAVSTTFVSEVLGLCRRMLFGFNPTLPVEVLKNEVQRICLAEAEQRGWTKQEAADRLGLPSRANLHYKEKRQKKKKAQPT